MFCSTLKVTHEAATKSEFSECTKKVPVEPQHRKPKSLYSNRHQKLKYASGRSTLEYTCRSIICTNELFEAIRNLLKPSVRKPRNLQVLVTR